MTVTPTTDDTTPPSAPGNLTVSDIKSNAATFHWTAATDNVGVVRYEINRGGNILKVVDGNTLSATVDTLTANTAYDISVGAFDAAGNASQQSNVVTFTTPGSGDTQPPSVPGTCTRPVRARTASRSPGTPRPTTAAASPGTTRTRVRRKSRRPAHSPRRSPG